MSTGSRCFNTTDCLCGLGVASKQPIVHGDFFNTAGQRPVFLYFFGFSYTAPYATGEVKKIVQGWVRLMWYRLKRIFRNIEIFSFCTT